jgi:hypothetical protein
MPRRRNDTELKYVYARLKPVLEVLRKNPGVRNDFMRFGEKRDADLCTLAERLRQLRFKKWPPLPTYFLLLLLEFGYSGGILKRPVAPRRLTKLRQPSR